MSYNYRANPKGSWFMCCKSECCNYPENDGNCPDYCPKPNPRPPHPQPCVPKKGELVLNGSFELGVCSAGWDCIGNVKPQDQVADTGHNAHQGTGAVALGLSPNGEGGDASIAQLVEGICPGTIYKFSFFMSPHSYAPNLDINITDSFAGKYGNGEVKATLTFLDQSTNTIVGSKEILIPRDTLAFANNWTYYTTLAEAPAGARYAQIKIAITDPAWNWREHVHIDDVSLFAL